MELKNFYQYFLSTPIAKKCFLSEINTNTDSWHVINRLLVMPSHGTLMPVGASLM